MPQIRHAAAIPRLFVILTFAVYFSTFAGCGQHIPDDDCSREHQTGGSPSDSSDIVGSWETKFNKEWQSEAGGKSLNRRDGKITFWFKSDGEYMSSETFTSYIVRDKFSETPRVYDEGTVGLKGTWERVGNRIVAISGGSGIDPHTEEFQFESGALYRTRLETRTKFTQPQRLLLVPR